MEGHDYMVARMLLGCGNGLWFVERESKNLSLVWMVVLQKYGGEMKHPIEAMILLTHLVVLLLLRACP